MLRTHVELPCSIQCIHILMPNPNLPKQHFQSEDFLVLEKCITSVTCRKVYIIPTNPNANPWEEIGHQLQGHSDCHETSLLLVSTASRVIAIITDSDLHSQGVPIIIIAHHISF